MFKIWIDRISQECQRRKLMKSIKELNRLYSELSMGIRPKEWVLEQIETIYVIAQDEDHSSTIPSSFPPPIRNEKPTDKGIFHNSDKKPPPMNLKPPLNAPNPASYQTPKAADFKHIGSIPNPLPRPPEPIKFDNSVNKQNKDSKYINQLGNINKKEILSQAKTEMQNCESADQAAVILSTLKSTLEDHLAGKILYEIKDLTRLIRSSNSFDKNEIVKKISEWEKIV